MLKFINLKNGEYSKESAIATVEIEIENAKKEGIVAIKVLHGYGSKGRGGVIMQELRKALSYYKRRGIIKNYFGGDKWNMFDEDTKQILMRDKTIFGDCDLDSSNPGITIIEI